ncbi:frizzled-9-like [Convolutriloba macropyga]|uniref:frizzled-9-like n=1 Tax=Convolutriloba macropyga TaxID=536237 RepID=UPI003F51E009
MFISWLLVITLANLVTSQYTDSQRCELDKRKYVQNKDPDADITCRRVQGNLFNNSILQLDASGKAYEPLPGFPEIAGRLLHIAAESCNPELETCVSMVLAYGCGVQYEVCLQKDDSVKPMKMCKDFCVDVQQCIALHPEINDVIREKVSEATLSMLTNQRCVDVGGISSSRGKQQTHVYCRFNQEERKDLKSYVDAEKLYPQWNIQRCCSASSLSDSVTSAKDLCCNSDHFYKVDGAKQCVMKCASNSLYSTADQLLAFNWILICASVCAISSAITVLTYFADVTRFAYPEKPIICHSVCCFFYACGHFFRIFTGVNGVACTEAREGRVYLQEGLNGEFMCTVSFLLIYYSQMALHVWWVVLAISWFLTAVKGWSQEALEAISIWFHVSAWAIPTVQTVVTLATKRFEGDPLTGLCVVGSQTAINLLFFVIIPIAFCALLGLLLITYGFISVFQVRKRLRTTKIDANLSGVDTKRFDKLMIRMAVFTISYIVPTMAYLALTTFEFTQIPRWYESANVIDSPYVPPEERPAKTLPEVYITLIRIFNPFVLCIGTCFWILNCKTLKLWSRVIFRCCHTPYDYNKGAVSVQYAQASNPNLLIPATQYRVTSPSNSNNNNNNNSSPTPANKNGKKSPSGQQQITMSPAYNNGAMPPTQTTRYDMGKI